MKPLKVYLPIKGAILTQGFAKNFNKYYVGGGLLGHTGNDYISYISSEILTSVEGAYTYKIINKNNPDLSKYRCVFQIVETDDGVAEISYGHCSDIYCQHGPSLLGEKIAKEGNTGNVFTGGVEVTEKEKEAGSTKGTHVHLQGRWLNKVDYYDRTIVHISDEKSDSIPYTKDGFYYQVKNYNNGFNGCFDLAPFIVQEVTHALPQDIGSNHFDTPLPPNIQQVLDKSTSDKFKEYFLVFLKKFGVIK